MPGHKLNPLLKTTRPYKKIDTFINFKCRNDVVMYSNIGGATRNVLKESALLYPGI